MGHMTYFMNFGTPTYLGNGKLGKLENSYLYADAKYYNDQYVKSKPEV